MINKIEIKRASQLYPKVYSNFETVLDPIDVIIKITINDSPKPKPDAAHVFLCFISVQRGNNSLLFLYKF